MSTQEHWDRVYRTKEANQVSWYRPHLEFSLELIERLAADRSAAIVDVGGGASYLIDDLCARGYKHITVVDIAQTALDIAKNRLGLAAVTVQWLCADVTHAVFPREHFDVWHDRAVFHFLTDAADRTAYARSAASAVKPGGHLIISTFGPEGPLKCSGLDVVRYDTDLLQKEFAPHFHLEESVMEWHRTPFETDQQFLCCHLTRMP